MSSVVITCFSTNLTPKHFAQSLKDDFKRNQFVLLFINPVQKRIVVLICLRQI